MNGAINKYCPRSGKPIANDSFTNYRGHIVGFCNPNCRDDFASDNDKHFKDKAYFDTIIKECELTN